MCSRLAFVPIDLVTLIARSSRLLDGRRELASVCNLVLLSLAERVHDGLQVRLEHERLLFLFVPQFCRIISDISFVTDFLPFDFALNSLVGPGAEILELNVALVAADFRFIFEVAQSALVLVTLVLFLELLNDLCDLRKLE